MVEVSPATTPGACQAPSHTVRPLSFGLEFSCPPALSHKLVGGTTWPFEHCGPSTRPIDAPSTFLRRRYLETLLLPEVSAIVLATYRSWCPELNEQILMPLRDLQADIARIGPDALPAAITPLLISLRHLERRHRTILRGLMGAIISGMTSNSLPEVKRALLDDAIHASGLEGDEVAIVKVAMELRPGSRRATESGDSVDMKRLAGELEKRE